MDEGVVRTCLGVFIRCSSTPKKEKLLFSYRLSLRKSRIAFVGPSSNIPFSCVISLCCSCFLQTDIKLESLTTPRVGWSLLLAVGQCDYEVDMHTLPHFMGGKVKPSICHQLYRRHVKAILQKCFLCWLQQQCIGNGWSPLI